MNKKTKAELNRLTKDELTWLASQTDILAKDWMIVND